MATDRIGGSGSKEVGVGVTVAGVWDDAYCDYPPPTSPTGRAHPQSLPWLAP